MNILTSAPPDAIVINGIELSILTDYRLWIQVGEVFRESAEMEIPEVIDTLAALIMRDDIPPALEPEDFVTSVIAFYRGYPQIVGQGQKNGKPEKVKRQPDYNFLADSEFIYSSFAQVYGIRLTLIEMHWWEFLTLFDGLMFAEQNAISFVIGTRQRDLKKATKEERARITKLKRDFALPKAKNDEKAEDNLRNILMGGKADGG